GLMLLVGYAASAWPVMLLREQGYLPRKTYRVYEPLLFAWDGLLPGWTLPTPLEDVGIESRLHRYSLGEFDE
ncbi:MAG: hypothetical protein JWN70_3401, partial [Planctomycetaceae bacterium]|nr:hypothetical protein [Planctomycetaceae bacterium]